MGVSKNRGIPKWMVQIRENPIKMNDLGIGHPYTRWAQNPGINGVN